jgi:hypothetical protein
MVDNMSNIGTTDFDYQVALGLVDGFSNWSIFGHNLAVPIGTEVLAPFGGLWTPLLGGETMSVVSTSVNDIAAGSGATQVLIEGITTAYAHLSEVVVLNGTTPVMTSGLFLAINRVSVTGAGASQGNEGDITLTSAGSATIEAQISIGEGVSHQCIYTTSANGTMLMRSLHINALNVGGAAPKLTVKGWVYNDTTGAKYEVLRHSLDTALENFNSYSQVIPFVIAPASSFWLEVTSDKAASEIYCRLSLVENDT